MHVHVVVNFSPLKLTGCLKCDRKDKIEAEPAFDLMVTVISAVKPSLSCDWGIAYKFYYTDLHLHAQLFHAHQIRAFSGA